MHINELIAQLLILKAQYGDIEVTVKGQQSFQINLEVVDELDPKSLTPIGKAIIAS